MNDRKRNDAQFAAPDQAAERPRLLPGIVAITMDTGILIDGLGRREVLGGPLAQTILPELLRMLDGTRTLRGLEEALPAVPPEYLRAAVAALKDWGIVEKPTRVPHSGLSGSNTASFLLRHAAASEFHFDAAEACAGLKEAKIVIAANGLAQSCAETLRRLLQASGVGSIELLAGEHLQSSTLSEKSVVVALSTMGEEPDWYTALDNPGNRPASPWLRAVIREDATQMDVGPLFTPEGNTCYQCFRDTHALSTGRPAEPVEPVAAGNADLWASFTALEIIYLLALPSLGLQARQFRRFYLPHWISKTLIYPRLPGCRRCERKALLTAPAAGRNDMPARVTDTALLFEEYVGLESRDHLSPGAKKDFSQIIHLPGEEGPRFANCERVPLYRGNLRLDTNALEAMRTGKKSGGGALTIDKLAAILAITAGIREISKTALRRWAATAGNLGSVELFIVSREVAGLNRGFYFYEARDHELVELKKRAGIGVSEFMCRVLGTPKEDDLPDALVVFVGAFERLSRKYGSFAYRLIHLDAGAAISQLDLVARGMDLCVRAAPGSAEDLIQEQLNLAPAGETPTIVVEISGAWRKERRSKPNVPRDGSPSPYPRSWKPAHEYSGLDTGEITTMLLDEGRVLEREAHQRPDVAPELLLSDRGRQALTVKLPKPARRGLSIEEILAKRESVRKYGQRPVRACDLGTALDCASSADSTLSAGARYDFPLGYLVLAKRVLGMDPGVYMYDFKRHGLCKTRAPLSCGETEDLLIQNEYASAPVLIWITGNLAAACASEGAAGHRRLLLRAGMAGHRLWMAALSLGLSGSIFAGLVPGAARRLLEIDGYTTASLFAFVAGYPESNAG